MLPLYHKWKSAQTPVNYSKNPGNVGGQPPSDEHDRSASVPGFYNFDPFSFFNHLQDIKRYTANLLKSLF
jgi:hypothetical protein